jgi:hypothetical protein
MVSSLRKEFNRRFSHNAYNNMLNELAAMFPGAIEFRLAETPVFVSRFFCNQMLAACESIIDVITDPSFRNTTSASIPPADKVPGDYSFPQTLVFDFGVCVDVAGEIVPQLIEMQGFPSLYGFQVIYPEVLRRHFYVPSNYSHYLNGLNRISYEQKLKEVLLGGHSAQNVVLLEIKPHEQKTRVDFYATRDITGIQPVCITELIQDGSQLFYESNGEKTRINRIYNRIIFDELNSRTDLGNYVDIRHPFDVEWVPHPDWFYRISKYTLPFIVHPFVPETYFLYEVKQLPKDLENFVLKPLFSFAGQGVIIDVRQEDIERIADPHNWILQQKVEYADIIETPDGFAKTEIRIMYLWEQGKARPQPAINLARLSKGKMIGTRYNKDKSWVGGSVAFIET